MKIRCEFEIEDEALTDLFVSACNGARYWAKVPDVLPDPIFPFFIVDVDRGVSYRITSNHVKKAFAAMSKINQGERLGRILDGDYDQEDADVFLQAGIYGEVVYG